MQANDHRGARLLLVDDQPANLDVLGELLEAEGYRISMVPSGPIALKVAAQARPDLVLLDVMMPEMDGYEVCRLKASDQTRDIPVVFITGRTQQEDLVAGFQAGGVDYITKPFQDEEVLVRETHVRMARMNAHIQQQNQALEEANRQVQEANRLKSDFLARMSHDLRTPMNAIVGYTRILLRKSKDALEERQYRNLGNIRLCADNLLALLNDILDLSRIEADRIDLREEEVDLGDLARTCAASVESLLKPGVELRLELAPIAPVRTDQDRLRRVLMNLLGNAVKFTDSGAITLALKQGNGTVELSVADTGVGISPDDLPHIFDEFRQVEQAGQNKGEGSGLGLAIAKKSVELLGGDIGVESQLGSGTCFWVRLKIAP